MPDTLSVSRDFADIDPQYMGIFATAGRYGVRPADPLAMPVDEARRAAQSYHAIWTLKPPPLAHVHETTFPGPAGPVRLRLYVPEPQAAERARPPVMIYFHGGGFVLNGLETHDGLMRLIAAEAGIAVCAVSYSLAPEHRFPTQLLEAVAAIGWLRENADDMGVDAGRIAVGGDSAGANLALSATLALRDEGRSPVAMAVLSYGMFAADFDTPSHHRFGGGQYGLTTERMRWYWQQYLGQQGDPADPRAAPLLADLRGLPPVMLIAAGADCLLDDSIRLADRLTEADVPNRLSIHPRRAAFLPPTGRPPRCRRSRHRRNRHRPAGSAAGAALAAKAAKAAASPGPRAGIRQMTRNRWVPSRSSCATSSSSQSM
jgi:acetyl esterase